MEWNGMDGDARGASAKQVMHSMAVRRSFCCCFIHCLARVLLLDGDFACILLVLVIVVPVLVLLPVVVVVGGGGGAIFGCIFVVVFVDLLVALFVLFVFRLLVAVVILHFFLVLLFAVIVGHKQPGPCFCRFHALQLWTLARFSEPFCLGNGFSSSHAWGEPNCLEAL